ncbi:hypothetical protein, partial [Peribacillus deserti]
KAPSSAFRSGETPQAKPRRLTARPAESEHPGEENHLLFNSNKICENSLLKKSAWLLVLYKFGLIRRLLIQI